MFLDPSATHDRRSTGRQIIRLDDVALAIAVIKHQQIGGLGTFIAARPVVLGGEPLCCCNACSGGERCQHQGAAGRIGTRGRESDTQAFAATAKSIATSRHSN